MTQVNPTDNWTQIKTPEAKQDGEKNEYSYTVNGMSIKSSTAGNIWLDSTSGQVYAEGLSNAVVKKTDKKDGNNDLIFENSDINSMELGDGNDEVTLFNSKVKDLNMGKGNDTINASGTTFTHQVKFADNKGDEFNVAETKETAEESKVFDSEKINKIKGMRDNSVKYGEKIENNFAESVKDQEIMGTAAKASNETSNESKPGSPKNSTVTVQAWGSAAENGEKYANDCLSRIVINNYGDIATPENMQEIYKAIQQKNPKITNIDLIYTGQKITLPELTIKDGKVTGIDDEDLDEDPIEEPQEDPVEEPQEDPIEEPQEDPVEEPQEDPVEEPQEDPVEEPQEDPVEEPQEDPVEEPQEDPVEEPQEDPVQEPQKDPSDGNATNNGGGIFVTNIGVNNGQVINIYNEGTPKKTNETDKTDDDNNDVEKPEENKTREEVHYNDNGTKDYTIEYDENGNDVKAVHYDADGNVTYYWENAFDENGNKTKAVCRDADGNIINSREFEYNENGVTTNVKEFDKDGKITEETHYSDEGVKEYTIEYDENGHDTKATHYDADGNITYWWENEFDGNNKTKAVRRDADGNIINSREFEYNENGVTTNVKEFDKDGKITEETHYSDEGVKEYTIEYDENGNDVTATHYDADGNVTYYWENIFDENGNKIKAIKHAPDGTILEEGVPGE